MKTPPTKANALEDSVIMRVARKLERRRAQKEPPRIDSFADFLAHHARVKSGSGYIPYHFTGREALRPIVERLDQILASGATDASLAICGGAQFGKTVLMLNLLAYLVAVRFRNVGYYLPDDDLVSGLVDGKLRPDVLDQIPWLARLIAVGKTLIALGPRGESQGRVSLHRRHAYRAGLHARAGKNPDFVLDGRGGAGRKGRSARGARALSGRTHDGFEFAAVAADRHAALSRRGAESRLHGRDAAHRAADAVPAAAQRHNPETLWPGICRLEMPELPVKEWPRLTVEGHFAFVNRCTTHLLRGRPRWLTGKSPWREAP